MLGRCPGVLVEAIPFQSEWGWYVVLKGTKAYGEHSSPENQIITTTKTTSQRTTAEKWLKPLPQAQIWGETDFQRELTVDILVCKANNIFFQIFFENRHLVDKKS